MAHFVLINVARSHDFFELVTTRIPVFLGQSQERIRRVLRVELFGSLKGALGGCWRHKAALKKFFFIFRFPCINWCIPWRAQGARNGCFAGVDDNAV